MTNAETKAKIYEYKEKKTQIDREITVLEVGIETSTKKLGEIKELLIEEYPDIIDMDIDKELEKLGSALAVLEKEYREEVQQNDEA